MHIHGCPDSVEWEWGMMEWWNGGMEISSGILSGMSCMQFHLDLTLIFVLSCCLAHAQWLEDNQHRLVGLPPVEVHMHLFISMFH
jgi:hypothetical protein